MEILDYSTEKARISEMLMLSDGFSETQNLLELGLNSLQIMRLVNEWRKRGIRVTFAQLMEQPVFEHWWQILSRNQKQSLNVGQIERKKIQKKREIFREAFDLTDVQYAYWIGRAKGQPLGNIGCHAYLEFDGEGVEPNRLEEAWAAVRQHHPMLRMSFVEPGQQKILAQSNSQLLKVYDFRTSNDYKNELYAIREQLSHRKLNVEEGEVSGLSLSLLPQNRTRVHFDVDLLVADVQSMQIILRDLNRAYKGESLPKKSAEWCFRTYLKEQRENEAEAFEVSKSYWQKRLPNLPLGPELPLKKRPEEIGTTRFSRRVFCFSNEQLKRFKELSARNRTTFAMVLLTAYAKVLERYSNNSHFLINIPLFNRKTEINGIEDVVSDFTTLLLLEIDEREPQSFLTSLRKIEQQLRKDMGYASYSGVRIQRDLAKEYAGQRWFAPVVFACNLGDPLIDQSFEDNLGEFTYMISQTPQVWLDFQIFESEHGLMLAWDAVDELFPEGLIDNMFTSLTSQLEQLITDSEWNQQYELLPVLKRTRIEAAMQAVGEGERCCLHEAFFAYAASEPQKCAVIDSGTGAATTYGQLAANALSAAAEISKYSGGEPIAITLPRGVEQIVAVIGILASGNYYIPVSDVQPTIRRQQIHTKNNIHCAITNRALKQSLKWPMDTVILTIEDIIEAVPLDEIKHTQSNQLAYIILTSGSTGEPKGVEITHQAAVNTIDDVNRRYNITDKDKVLAVSALDFDLSVYDIFGLLGCGGQIVTIPDSETRNARYWQEQILNYGVTIWNSVPILLDMLLIAVEDSHSVLPFEKVILSGDWIGLDIPGRLFRNTEGCRLFSMGGATEAAIWSNYFEVSLPLPSDWVSIPYGAPLANQVYRVVDQQGRDCPDWVKGELWIGGASVAQGYRGEAQLTAEKFLERDGLRWYRTGDFGRFWADDTIEFMGRTDFQVKIRGHRIETGEIEAALKTMDGICEAVVIAAGDRNAERYLAAFITTEAEHHGCHSFLVHNPEDAIIGEQIIEKAFTQELPVDIDDSVTQERFCEFIEYCDQIGRKVINHVFEEADTKASYQWLLDRSQKIPIAMKADYYGMSDYRKAISKYGDLLKTNLPKVISGAVPSYQLFYAECPELSPIQLLQNFPGDHLNREIYVQCAVTTIIEQSKKSRVKVIDLASRDSRIIKKILSGVEGYDVEYTYADHSLFFVNQIREELSDYPGISYSRFEQTDNGSWHGLQSCSYELVISYHGLHRYWTTADIPAEQSERLLRPGGILLFSELCLTSILVELTAGLLNTADGRFDPSHMETEEQWMKSLIQVGYNKVSKMRHTGLKNCGRFVVMGQTLQSKAELDTRKIEHHLTGLLPDYMVPRVYCALDVLPMTVNGKLDRKVLQSLLSNNRGEVKRGEVATAVQKTLKKIFEKVFQLEQIGIHDNYFELGGDSLVATKLVVELRNVFDISISIGAIFEHPTISVLAAAIEQQDGSGRASIDVSGFKAEQSERYLPFPLTDIQHAYFMGRSGLYDLGQVATHCYFELAGGVLSVERMNQALNRLIQHHEMMRTVILSTGEQIIQESVPDYQIDVIGDCYDSIEATIQEVRTQMSHQVIDIHKWPLFDIKAVVGQNGDVRLHISFDNIIFDGWSMFQILKQWAQIYDQPDLKLEPLQVSFRDYVLFMERMKHEQKYADDRNYWMERILTLPSGPDFTLEKDPGSITRQKFSRRSYTLSVQRWNQLRAQSSELGITPSILLMTVFSEVLHRWSGSSSFTLNLTQFSRIPVHPQVDQLVGDFTSLTLLEVNAQSGEPLKDKAFTLQKQLLEDMEHSLFGGVEVQRELARERGHQGAAMPVVFTSGIGVEQLDDSQWLGRLQYNISQTPQVWLDHQVTELNGSLQVSWDSVDELFGAGMLDQMFETYTRLLDQLADDSSLWQSDCLIDGLLPGYEYFEEANRTDQNLPESRLEDLFLEAAAYFPDRIAVIDGDVQVSYRELQEKAYGIAATLKDHSVGSGECVGVFMDKCWEQIAAVYGILMAGAAYLPLDTHNPPERLKLMMDNSKVNCVLTTSKTPDLIELPKLYVDLIAGLKTYQPSTERKPDDLAYIIYTSGSTGQPKGVMIDHKGAANTILDINSRYGVTKEDRVLALSQLYFDLSVYDIFGLLAVGGMVVIPDSNRLRDPAYWLTLIQKHCITVWNSVPMFLQMLTEYSSSKQIGVSMRLILLSGDWIPVHLPDEIRALSPGCRVIGMGGATEASIWSNAYEVPKQGCGGMKSIPYGKPLANQRYYILNDRLERCPVWVPGMLYIAGKGVARGYCNDPEKTAAQFIEGVEGEAVVYKTGDLGRLWPDGNIEFLGRVDTQIKINGFRVELGEIEAALNQHILVDSAYVISTGESSHRMLTAVVVSNRSSEFDPASLKEYLSEKLPEYMVPQQYLGLTEIPLTVNGKVDRKKLTELVQQNVNKNKSNTNSVQKQNEFDSELESEIANLWKEIIGCQALGAEDNFFELGGNSLQAIRLVNSLNQRYHEGIGVEHLFDGPTVRELSRIVSEYLSA